MSLSGSNYYINYYTSTIYLLIGAQYNYISLQKPLFQGPLWFRLILFICLVTFLGY